MKIETKYAGEVEINPNNIIQFEQGIPSFEEEKEFILLPYSEEQSPFYILQSVKTSGLAFMVMTPFTFFPDYEAKLSDSVIEQLAIEKQEDVALFVIITLRETLQESTVNLKGPIVVNSAAQKGKQVVLNDTAYHTKHALVAPVAAGQKEE
ncbi:MULTISPECIES: flagellar assembly protein FliW [Bacillaceae]|uniref:Flagellar assembly factor FliW n=1 Tax=Evansella alkalicola TaxID=745819 RepID=A0ABS6JUG3_9BACI|nr:flagellar assembly protein FliW [Litchfieldia alkalitelluris]MBU9721726.1 flagellar assembly protein FliW [Bacillus alkalicola]